MKIPFLGGVTGKGPQAIWENPIPAGAAQPFTAKAQLYIPLGWNAVQLNIGWYTAGGALISFSSGAIQAVPPGYAAGTLITATGTSPATTARAQIVIQFFGNPSPTITASADVCALVSVSVTDSALH